VPKVRDFLDRFRPAGTPGAASSVGVPADRRADAEQELAPVFAALEDVERECAELRVRAERDAQRQIAQAQRMAGALVARARAGSAAERAAAAADARGRAAAETDRILAQARQTAGDARAQAQRRLPELVDRAVELARARADAVGQEVTL
jgi:cell division septum initiation protein DivIVA